MGRLGSEGVGCAEGNDGSGEDGGFFAPSLAELESGGRWGGSVGKPSVRKKAKRNESDQLMRLRSG
jgi:hypothetical protein